MCTGNPDDRRTIMESPHAPLTMTLVASPAAPGAIRTLLGQALRKWGMEQIEFTVDLVASELVTNAVKATPGQEIRACFSYNGGSPLLEIWDSSDEVPVLKSDSVDLDDGDFDGNGGLGLHLVGSLAAQFGYRRDARCGKTVFARFHPYDCSEWDE